MSTTNEDLSAIARWIRAAGAATDLAARAFVHASVLFRDARSDALAVARESEALWTAVGRRAVEIWSAVKATPRLGRVLGEGLRLAAHLRLRAAMQAAGAEPGSGREAARRIRDMCLELRGGVLKIGQLASSRVDIFPMDVIEELAVLQDRVPPVDEAAIRALVEAELGKPIDQTFASFGPAIAAASLAQVHEAVLLDGTHVAVKVLVPGIETIVEADLHALRVLAGACGGTLAGVDVATTVAELSRSVRAELDCRAEAAELEGFAARFSSRTDVLVPRVHRELCTQRVLIMERLSGERFADFLVNAPPEAREQIITTMVDCFTEQILEHGVCHADPHPGNFLVVGGPEKPRLALLDFGCVLHLAPETRRAYAELVVAVLARDAVRTASLFAKLGFTTASGDPSALQELAELILAAMGENVDLGAIKPAEQLTRALAILERSPIARVPEHFILVGRVLASVGGLVFAYPPRAGIFGTIAFRLARAAA